MSSGHRSRAAVLRAAALVLASALGLVLRAGLLERHGLWADEIFSLATATGHSLEHPAAEADPALGDFVEPDGVVEAGSLRSYLEHAEPAASPARVVRAVLLSDTSPPLYYLLLNVWSRVTGTGDRELRLFSLMWGMASLPMIWLVARAIAGPAAAVTALVLFGVAPIAVFYSTEGRMYSMLWFLSLVLAAATLRLTSPEQPPSAGLRWSLLWGSVAGAGLLTHYFFAFVWIACAGWLWLEERRRRRVAPPAIATASSLLIAASWYWRLPESLGRWRITSAWLEEPLTPAQAWGAPWKLAWSYVSGGVDWKSWAPIASPFAWDRWVALALLAAAAGIGWSYRSSRRPRCGRGVALIWLWAAASLLGPLAFDLWRGTYTSLIPRYAQAGLPAVLLLLAIGLAWLPLAGRLVVVLGLLAAWTPAIESLYSMTSRSGPPYREIGAAVSRWAQPTKVVLVQSIPSGLLAIARYSEPDTPLASWIEQLGSRRVPHDMERLLRGRDEVALVEVHTVWARARPREWLEAHALGTGTLRGARLFVPACESGFTESCDARAAGVPR
jgi:hypothetical protein